MVKKVTKIEPIANIQGILEKPKLKVCAYVRVSTGSQKQAESYGVQIDYYMKLIDGNTNWQYAGIFADEATTGTKIKKRNEFQKMIQECKNGNVDLIITKSVTRFARNVVDCLQTVRMLKEIGIGVYFEKEKINTLEEKSEMFLTVLASLAQSESEDFSGNNRWSITKRYQNGTFIIGVPAYGYRNDKGSNLIIQEEEAKIIKWIFNSYLKGMGCHSLARQLNNMGIPAPRSKQWNNSILKFILKNPVYTGDMLYQKTYTESTVPCVRKTNNGERNQYLIEDNHPAIISREEAQAVWELMEYQRTRHKITSEECQNRYPYSSKIFCAECGNTFRRQKINIGKCNEKIRWICHKHIEDIALCKTKAINEHIINGAFVNMWNKLYTNPGTILEPCLDGLKSMQIGIEEKEQIELLDNQINEVNKQSRILNQVMRNGYLDPAIFMDKQNDFSSSLCELRRKRLNIFNKAKSIREIVKTEQIIGLLKSNNKLLQEFDDRLFELMVDKIMISPEHEVTFYLKNGINLTEKGVE